MKIYSLLIFFSCNCFGQSYFYNNRYYDNLLLAEAGISVGFMNCLTDLGGKPGIGKPFFKDINWRCTRGSAGIFFGVLYQYTIGARVEATIGRVTGADSLLKENAGDALQRYHRNLHFRSKIFELSLLAEFHPVSASGAPCRLSPYLVAGIGLFSFDPKARLNEQWISLRPLRTEGQLYGRTAMNVPVGAGLKYEISALFNARLEMLYRFLQTDYLDDVSTSYIDPAAFYRYFDPAIAALAAQIADRRLPNTVRSSRRGNAEKKDGYFSLTLKISVYLNRKRV